MNRHYKIFMLFAVVVIFIVSLKTYIENQRSDKIIKLSIQYEAQAVADFLVAFRKTYQDIFIKQHAKLDSTTINFLPVKTTNDIAGYFSILNTRVKVSTVSTNPRNPINKANERQTKVIEYFNKHRDKKSLFKKIDGVYYYSSPLYIKQACLKCHGKKEKAPLIIKRNYSEAYNYRIGDLRGIIDIRINETKLSKILQQNNNERVIFAIIALILILTISLIYTYYNKNIENKINELYENLSNKNRELEESEHEVVLINENLLKQKEEFESLYKQSADGIFILKDNHIIDCNVAALKMFGYDDKSVFINMPPSNLSPLVQPDGEESFTKSLKMINQAIQTGSHTFEWLNQKADGSTFWAEIVLTKMIQNTEFIIHAVIRDISKRKEDELALERLSTNLALKVAEEVDKNRQKDQQMLHQSRLAQMGEMISMIAHQWRQPLGAITARVGALLLKIKLKQPIEELMLQDELEKINEYAQHLSLTINDFRGFFKDDKDKEEITLKELIVSTLKIVQTSLDNKNIIVQTDFQCGKEFETYANELKQVVLNIIKNAEDVLIENKIKNPTISISTLCDIDGANQVILIKDNAGGIPEDIIDKIFDPYFSTKLEKDGTGLGLYMSKTIVEEHCGGTLSVFNDKDGAVFKIELNNTNGGGGRYIR